MPTDRMRSLYIVIWCSTISPVFVNTKSSKGIYSGRGSGPTERISSFFFLVCGEGDSMAYEDIFPLSLNFSEEKTVLP